MAPSPPELVTVAITSFNAQATIERAIASAVAQDWPNIEIVIVDDASTDETCARIESAIDGSRCPARLVKHKVNGGPAAARNTLLDNAQGQFVCFFDDDDESLPHRVRLQVERVLEAEAGATRLVACYGSGERLYPNGYRTPLHAIGSQGMPPKGEEVADYLLVYERPPDRFFGAGTPTCSLLARLDTFKRIGGFDSRLRRLEDVDFAIRLALQGGVFVGTSQSVFVQYATEAPDKSPARNKDAEIEVVRKQEAYLRQKGLYYYALNWPLLRYYHFTRQYFLFAIKLFDLWIRYPLRSVRHILATGPSRLRHERSMTR